MKIAVCISGHLRNSDLYIDNFKKNILNVFENNNINYDVFIFTYSNIVSTKIFSKKNKIPINRDISNETNNSLNNILKKIKVKKYKIETQKDESINKYKDYDYIFIRHKKTNVVNGKFKEEIRHRNLCQFKHRDNIIDMIDNIQQYYFILWIRPDIFYFEKININLMLKHDLVFPNNHRFGATQVHFTTVFGKRDIMIDLMKLYTHLKKDNYKLIDDYNTKYKTKNFFPNLLPLYFLKDKRNYTIFYNNFRDCITRFRNGEIIKEDRKDWNEFPNHDIEPIYDLSLCKKENTIKDILLIKLRVNIKSKIFDKTIKDIIKILFFIINKKINESIYILFLEIIKNCKKDIEFIYKLRIKSDKLNINLKNYQKLLKFINNEVSNEFIKNLLNNIIKKIKNFNLNIE